MYYPWLDVPFLTAPMVVALVAVVHVFVSHYAVGGGILLATENGRALRDGDEAYRNYWKKHAKFFILLTVVFGAITGVGIWWTIGLASPLATETLIRVFVFGWAIEWCFFLLEIVSGFVFYYFWDRLSPKKHAAVGGIYAFSAWISLVLISGITAFMLNSDGLVDDWARTGNFWHAFLNVQFLPQTVARTGCALIMGTFYVLLHASFVEKNPDVREKVTRRMRLPAFLGLVLLLAGVAGWAFFLPESALATLERAAATNVFSALFVGIVAAIVLLLIAGPVAKPRETSVGLALALFLLGIAGISVAEFVREAVRKPFIVDKIVYGNQIERGDVARLRANGLLYGGVWTRLYLDEMQEKRPDLKISAKNYLGWEPTRPAYWDKIDETRRQSPDDASAVPQEAPTTDESASVDRESLFVRETVAQAGRDGAANPRRNGGVLTGGVPAAPNAPRSREANFAPTSTNVAAPNPLATVAPAPQPAETQAPVPAPQPAETQEPAPLVPAPAPAPQPVETQEPAPQVPAPQPTETPSEAESLAERDERLNGPISEGNRDLLKLEPDDRRALGRAVFLAHCNDCHAARRGYSAVGPLVAGQTQAELKEFALKLNRSHHYMPPWCGTEVEAELLAEYLETIAAKVPANLYRKPASEKQEEPEKNADDSAAPASAN